MGKKKNIEPDDFFAAGPLKMARFGEKIIYEIDWAEDEFEEMQERLVKNLPEVVDKIEKIIREIIELVRVQPPEQLLKLAWENMAIHYIGIESEIEADSDAVLSVSILEYLQSIIASIEPAETTKDLSESDWKNIKNLIGELYNLVNYKYLICSTAKRKKEGQNFDEEYEKFYFKAQLYWTNVRGKRYSFHEKSHLQDLLSPHSRAINNLFGISSEELINELLKIHHSLTRGMINTHIEFGEFRDKSLREIEKKIEGNDLETSIAPPEILKEVVKENNWENWQEELFGKMFGLDLFDLQKITNLPQSLLEELSWSKGEEIEFLAEGEFKGWPLRILPIFKKPFIKISGRYYCFSLFSLFDNFYRILQRSIKTLNPDYATTWNNKQKEVSENLPINYFKKILPNSDTLQSIYYKWKTGRSEKMNWCEVDGIVTYDDHLFILEVKAGAFTYTSPANDFPAYIDSLGNLVLKPAEQGNRFLEYLDSEETVSIYDSNHEIIGELSKNDYRHISICAVSLDPFTELAAQVQHLKKIGIDVGEFPIWSLSIDDLRVYADIFTNPLIFLHFVEKRTKAFTSELIQTEDELDHLGLYIKHNDYKQYAEELAPDRNSKLDFHGYHVNVDKYFNEKLFDTKYPSPLNQDIPTRIEEIISFLSSKEITGRSFIVSFLLNCNFKWRNKISSGIDSTLEKQKELLRPLPFSVYGDIKLTVFCWHLPNLPRNKDLAIDHGASAMVIAGQSERLLIELLYDNSGNIKDIFWISIKLSELSNNQLKRANALAVKLRNKRKKNMGKIGRNDPCPCGSGKKFKKCCIDKF